MIPHIFRNPGYRRRHVTKPQRGDRKPAQGAAQPWAAHGQPQRDRNRPRNPGIDGVTVTKPQRGDQAAVMIAAGWLDKAMLDRNDLQCGITYWNLSSDKDKGAQASNHVRNTACGWHLIKNGDDTNQAHDPQESNWTSLRMPCENQSRDRIGSIAGSDN